MPKFLSLGVIGGADGPTAIFVSGPTISPLAILLCILAGAAIIGAVIWLMRRK